MTEEIKERLNIHFDRILRECQIPKYFKKSKLILLSKTDSEFPKINQTYRYEYFQQYEKYLSDQYYIILKE